MKSAYELALEKLESRGIEPPSEDNLTDAVREQIGEQRRRAEAKLAELEILHRDRLAQARSLQEREEEEGAYRSERRRIEEACEREIERLRAGT